MEMVLQVAKHLVEHFVVQEVAVCLFATQQQPEVVVAV